MNPAIQEQVIKILEKVTGGRVKTINPDDDLKNNLYLDSIQIVELFAELESELSIELPLKMMTVRTGKEFIQILEEQLAKNES